ncbi:MAG: hypothetical protein P1V97_34310, partial [Planctomycetota bacterium]|nr:hypothetical protein [Planctomycetota bacterium]
MPTENKRKVTAQKTIVALGSAFLLSLVVFGSDQAVRAQDRDDKKAVETESDYEAVHKLLKSRCFECHTEKEKENTGLVLTRFKNLEQALNEPEVFAKMLSRVQSGEMPRRLRST